MNLQELIQIHSIREAASVSTGNATEQRVEKETVAALEELKAYRRVAREWQRQDGAR